MLDAGLGDGRLQALYGRGGSDTYMYHKTIGQTNIGTAGTEEIYTDNDVLIFGDLTISDLSFSMAGSNLRMVWDDGVQSGAIEVGHAGNVIERFEFANFEDTAEAYTAADLIEMI